MFVDLSKAFDSINENLFVVKPGAFAFSRVCLQVIRSYLKNRKQRINVNSSFVLLLQENNDIVIYQRNIQILPTDIIKTIINFDPPIMEGMFNARPNNYN